MSNDQTPTSAKSTKSGFTAIDTLDCMAELSQGNHAGAVLKVIDCGNIRDSSGLLYNGEMIGVLNDHDGSLLAAFVSNGNNKYGDAFLFALALDNCMSIQKHYLKMYHALIEVMEYADDTDDEELLGIAHDGLPDDYFSLDLPES